MALRKKTPCNGEFSPEHQAILQRGISELAIQVPDAFISNVQTHLSMLNAWNRVHNLTAIATYADQIRFHVLDCLAALPHAEQSIAQNTGKANFAPSVVDVGSGAGFPGLVWAYARPDWRIFLVEANNKKLAFLAEMLRILHLNNTQVVHGRIEDWQAPLALDLITGRAVSSDSRHFLKCTEHLLLENGANCLGLMKSQDTPDFKLGNIEKTALRKIEVPACKLERLWIEFRRCGCQIAQNPSIQKEGDWL